MSDFNISIANKVIHISSFFSYTEILCRDYLAPDKEPDFSVEMKKKYIDYERSRASTDDFSDAYLESLAIYRKICSKLAFYDAFMMHGAVVAVDSKAYMFTASSGTGKTTHIQLWLDNIPGAYVVNGDKPVIIMDNKQAMVCGTPWSGKEKLNANTIVPLKAVVNLNRGDKNEIHEVTAKECFASVVKRTQMPADMEGAKRVTSNLEKFMTRVKFYEMQCNMNPEAAQAAWECLRHCE